jgi:hypothetical protein
VNQQPLQLVREFLKAALLGWKHVLCEQGGGDLNGIAQMAAFNQEVERAELAIEVVNFAGRDETDLLHWSRHLATTAAAPSLPAAPFLARETRATLRAIRERKRDGRPNQATTPCSSNRRPTHPVALTVYAAAHGGALR